MSLIAYTVSSCSQQELHARLEALTEQAAASSAIAAQLQAQQQRQQAHWEGVVHDLKVPTLPPLPLLRLLQDVTDCKPSYVRVVYVNAGWVLKVAPAWPRRFLLPSAAAFPARLAGQSEAAAIATSAIDFMCVPTVQTQHSSQQQQWERDLQQLQLEVGSFSAAAAPQLQSPSVAGNNSMTPLYLLLECQAGALHLHIVNRGLASLLHAVSIVSRCQIFALTIATQETRRQRPASGLAFATASSCTCGARSTASSPTAR